MKIRSLSEMKKEILEAINKPIPNNRIMSQDYDLWLNEQNQKERKDLK